MKALKFVGLALLALLVLVALAAGVIAARFDPAWARQKLTDALHEQKQRTLRIDGDLAMSFYPSLGVKLSKASLSEPKSTEEFARIDNAHVSVRVLPLLSRQLVVDRIEMDGVRARVVRGKDGRFNFDDLLSSGQEPGKEPTTPGEKPIGFDIAGVRITRCAVLYRDEGSGRSLQLDDVSAKTGRLSQAASGPLELAFKVRSAQPQLDAAFNLAGNYRYDLARKEYGIEKLALTVLGKLDGDPLDAKVDLSGIEGTNAALDIANVAAQWTLKQGTLVAQGRTAGGAHADLKAQALTLPKITGELQLAHPRLPVKQLKVLLDASTRVEWGQSRAAGNLSLRVEDSTVQGKFQVAKFAPLAAGFDLAIDKLDIDRYFPETAPAAKAAQPASEPGAGKEAPLDFAFLRGLDLKGALRIGSLKARNLKFNNVSANLVADKGRLDLAPLSAQLYGGTLAGSVMAQADGNRMALKQTMQNVDIGPLIRDYARKDILEGRGNLVLDVSTAGNSAAAVRQSLNGSARLSLRDGAVKGINLAKTLREGKALLTGGKDAVLAANKAEKTDFSELAASFRIADGVARNDDLTGKSPFLRVTGAGTIDLVREQIDYLVKATVVASATGQEGKELADLNGLTIPVRLTGAYDSPSYHLEFGGLAAELAKQQVQKRLGPQLEKQLGDKKALGDVLKGLLK